MGFLTIAAAASNGIKQLVNVADKVPEVVPLSELQEAAAANTGVTNAILDRRRRHEYQWRTCEHHDFTACSGGTHDKQYETYKMTGCNRRRTTRQSSSTYVELAGRRRRYCVMPTGHNEKYGDWPTPQPTTVTHRLTTPSPTQP